MIPDLFNDIGMPMDEATSVQAIARACVHADVTYVIEFTRLPLVSRMQLKRSGCMSGDEASLVSKLHRGISARTHLYLALKQY